MHLARRYSSLLTANAAAAYLRQNALLAQVSGAADSFSSVLGYGVFVDGHHLATAQALLDVFDRLPPVPTGWEGQSLPDLSRLNASLRPACPHCGVRLPLDAAQEACPACGGSVDIAELITLAHGPEVLAPCFDEPDEMRFLQRECRQCGYDLEGLEEDGVCPECGQPFRRVGE